MFIEKKQMIKDEGSIWFRRFVQECNKISPHIRIKRIKLGFYRIYWGQAYLHEVYKEMPLYGFDMDEEDPRFESKKYFEEYEDRAELTRKIKNYVEGYHESIDRIRTRAFLMKNNKEFRDKAERAYRQTVVK